MPRNPEGKKQNKTKQKQLKDWGGGYRERYFSCYPPHGS